ncbi:MAG: urocanate hydratase [Planctomycetes bacterium]|nr:urocanate hydratase [Planctomycetota bacterium]
MSPEAIAGPRPVRAPRGNALHCANWQIEAAFRMIQNNLDPEVAEDPDRLVVYGGSGKAARSWPDFDRILACLQRLKPDETMLVQSGRAVGVFRTHEDAPRVLIANSNLVGKWADWDEFRRLEAMGLTMFGQMTAGSWIYIGSQGILQGTYETFAAAARQHWGAQADLAGRLVVTGGCGGMGGAQPLSVTLNGGVCLIAEVDRSRAEKRIATRYLDAIVDDIDAAIDAALEAKRDARTFSVAWIGPASDLCARLLGRDVIPDLLTDQTSAHDLMNGYVPDGMSFADALEQRSSDPERYLAESKRTVRRHVELMVALLDRGAITFDYGNNIRTAAHEEGYDRSYAFPGFVPAYVRPLFCEGKGPFRWVALSGEASDIHRTDELVLEMFPDNRFLCRWIELARDKVAFQGLPSRICWLGYGERDRFAVAVNELVASGEISAPIVFGRDHLDCGSVASPYRETEDMKDGSDAIADWPILNALLSVATGATWTSFHHGGGVGIGYSLHAGQVAVADGTPEAGERLKRVLIGDPGIGIVRHADAGYEEARSAARRFCVDLGQPTKKD